MKPVVLWAIFAENTHEDPERGTMIEGVAGHVITLDRGPGPSLGEIHGKLQLHMLVEEGVHKLEIIGVPPIDYGAFATFKTIAAEENLSNQEVEGDFPFLINDDVALTTFLVLVDGVEAGRAYITAIRR